MRSLLRVGFYRFRSTFRRRWFGYATIVLLTGLVGGVAMGAIAGARRTQSSFPVYAASTHPAQVQAFDAFLDPEIGINNGYDPARASAIAHLPHVKEAETVVGFDANLVLLSHLHTHAEPGEKPPVFEGSTDGDFTNEDRVTLVQGRLADPARRDEVVMNAQAAHQLGLHIGSTVRLGFNSDAQLLSPDCCSAKATPPKVVVDLRLVGIVVVASTVVQDDVDALGSQVGLFTPALTRQLAQCCATYSSSALRGRRRRPRDTPSCNRRSLRYSESGSRSPPPAPTEAKEKSRPRWPRPSGRSDPKRLLSPCSEGSRASPPFSSRPR